MIVWISFSFSYDNIGRIGPNISSFIISEFKSGSIIKVGSIKSFSSSILPPNSTLLLFKISLSLTKLFLLIILP